MTNLLRAVKAWLREIGAVSLSRAVAGIVLAHNLAQAVPWLIALVISAGVGLYGALSSNHLVLALAVAVGTGSSLSLLISFGSWYMEKRRTGFITVVKERNKQLAERGIDAEDAENFRLGLQVILDVSTHPLVIRDAHKADEDCEQWLRRFVLHNLDTLSPGIRIGVLNWTAGKLKLACEGNLPHVVHRVLPKESPRDFTECLLDIDPRAKRLLLFEDERAEVAEWLVVIPEQKAELSARAFIGFVRQALAAARRALLAIDSAGADEDDEGLARPTV
jgi:hypothetical protein